MQKQSTLAIAAACAMIATGAWAGGGASDYAPGKNQDAWVGYYTAIEPTGSPTPGGGVSNLGGAISGGFYGNTSNAGTSPYAPDNGHGVTPSISPGPQTVGGGGPGTGTSIGDFIQGCRDGTC